VLWGHSSSHGRCRSVQNDGARMCFFVLFPSFLQSHTGQWLSQVNNTGKVSHILRNHAYDSSEHHPPAQVEECRPRLSYRRLYFLYLHLDYSAAGWSSLDYRNERMLLEIGFVCPQPTFFGSRTGILHDRKSRWTTYDQVLLDDSPSKLVPANGTRLSHRMHRQHCRYFPNARRMPCQRQCQP
jgi:hypothetical protein